MSLQIPDYQIARPLSLIDALEERSRLDQSRQQQKLNEMKMRAAQEEMDRDTAFRGAFSNGSPSPADLYRIDPEKAAQYEKNQLGIQSGTREFIKGAATDLYNRAKLIQDPAQQQAAIDRYIQPLKPQLQRMGLPMNEPVTMDHLKMILGQTPEESQQANINAKIAEKQGLFPYEMAETEAKTGAQLQKAKTLADYEHGLKMQESQNKPLTEAQSNAKLYASRMDKANQILESLNDDYSPFSINATLGSEQSWIPGAGAISNSLLSKNDQKAMQAQRDFLSAVLRKESGAAISQSEFNNGNRQYFPQPGDSDEVKKQKAENRKTAIEEIRSAVPGEAQSKATQAINNKLQEWESLPSNAIFITPDGRRVRKP